MSEFKIEKKGDEFSINTQSIEDMENIKNGFYYFALTNKKFRHSIKLAEKRYLYFAPSLLKEDWNKLHDFSFSLKCDKEKTGHAITVETNVHIGNMAILLMLFMSKSKEFRILVTYVCYRLTEEHPDFKERFQSVIFPKLLEAKQEYRSMLITYLHDVKKMFTAKDLIEITNICNRTKTTIEEYADEFLVYRRQCKRKKYLLSMLDNFLKKVAIPVLLVWLFFKLIKK